MIEKLVKKRSTRWLKKSKMAAFIKQGDKEEL